MANSKKNKKQSKNEDIKTIEGVVTDLIRSVSSLRNSFPTLSGILKKDVLESSNHIHNFSQKHIENSDNLTLSFEIKDFAELKRLLDRFMISSHSLKYLHEGQFLALVSRWDAFVGQVIGIIHDKNPILLNNSERKVSFSELIEHSDIDSIRRKIIYDKVESVMRQSHSDHFEYLEKKIGIKLREQLDIWPVFIELTQRRHLLSHTDGRISAQYIKICKEAGCDVSGLKIEEYLHIDDEYFIKSCDCLVELGVKLGIVMWNKLEKDPENINRFLISVTFEMICNEYYKPAVAIQEFFLKPPLKPKNARDLTMININLAQSYKWSGQADKCKQILDGQDWSALSDIFLLARAVLTDNFVEASSIMKRIAISDEMTKEYYRDWPLFKEFRKSNYFIDAYSEIFGVSIELNHSSILKKDD
jgi:hypothetical protein